MTSIRHLTFTLQFYNGLHSIVWQMSVWRFITAFRIHCMSAMASQIIGVSCVCLTVCPGADQRKHQSSASLAFVWGIHRCPVTRKMFPFDDVIMTYGEGLWQHHFRQSLVTRVTGNLFISTVASVTKAPVPLSRIVVRINANDIACEWRRFFP